MKPVLCWAVPPEHGAALSVVNTLSDTPMEKTCLGVGFGVHFSFSGVGFCVV